MRPPDAAGPMSRKCKPSNGDFPPCARVRTGESATRSARPTRETMRTGRAELRMMGAAYSWLAAPINHYGHKGHKAKRSLSLVSLVSFAVTLTLESAMHNYACVQPAFGS